MWRLNKTLFLILGHLLSDVYAQQENRFFRNDYNYIDSTESFYKVHTVTKNWRDAKKICGLEGASLFYPENQIETDAVLEVLNVRQKSKRWVYIGVSDILAKEVFEAIDGTPISDIYNNWAPGWPTGKHEQNCVSIHHPDGILREEDCSEKLQFVCRKKLQFVCRKKLQDLEWNAECQMSNIDYKYNATLGKCYKFHLNPLNWTDAYFTCSAEQSYLAIINSQAEADFLVKITAMAQKDKVAGSYLRGAVHIGFHNRYGSGWETIRGTPLNDSGYTWDPRWNQPDNAGGHETCGSMFYSGVLNDISCETNMFFICEHDLDTLSDSFDYRFSNNIW